MSYEVTEDRNHAAPAGRRGRRDENQARPGRGRRGAKKTEEAPAKAAE